MNIEKVIVAELIDFHAYIDRNDVVGAERLLFRSSMIDIDGHHNSLGALHRAARLANGGNMTLMLLRNGANPNLKTLERQESPLHYAAWFSGDHVDRILYLLQYKADANALDYLGRSALYWCNQAKYHRGALLLLLNGARPLPNTLPALVQKSSKKRKAHRDQLLRLIQMASLLMNDICDVTVDYVGLPILTL